MLIIKLYNQVREPREQIADIICQVVVQQLYEEMKLVGNT